VSDITKRNIMKEDFGWEIPVEMVPIPSSGLVYSPESILYKKETVKIKAMTAREEDILASQALIKEGSVLEHLIRSCVLEERFPVEDLMMGDRNAIMIAIRVTGYGPDYPVNITCQNCGEKNNVDVSLTNIPIKRLDIQPVEEGANLFSFKLPVTKKNVIFKFNTIKSEKERKIKERSYKSFLTDLINPTVTSALESCIVQIDDIKDPVKIKHFVQNMPAYDSRKLRNFIRDNEPGMDMTANATCRYCQHNNKFVIPITSEFFWPST